MRRIWENCCVAGAAVFDRMRDHWSAHRSDPPFLTIWRLLAIGVMSLLGAPGAMAGTLTGVSVTLSDYHAGATPVVTIGFTTATPTSLGALLWAGLPSGLQITGGDHILNTSLYAPADFTVTLDGVDVSGNLWDGALLAATSDVIFQMGDPIPSGTAVVITLKSFITNGPAGTSSFVDLFTADSSLNHLDTASPMPSITLIAAAAAPTATTSAASSVNATGATLNGTVNDNGASTAVTFEYGATAAYGSSTSATPATVAAGAGATAVSATISSLACNSLYHFRVIGANGIGTTNGSDLTFTTSACVPGAPTIGLATAGNGQADVSWTAPASTGGAAITGYQVQVATSSGGVYADAAGTCAPAATNASTAVSCTATGLANGTQYFFKVAAINSAGIGSYSAASSGVTPVAPVTYTVTYNGNTNTGGTAPTDGSSPYTTGSTVTVLGNSGTLTKTGHTFNNWNTAAGGGGTSYAPGASFAIAANTTLYAQWTAVPISGATSIPTLSEWGMICLSGLMAIFGFVHMRRHQGMPI